VIRLALVFLSGCHLVFELEDVDRRWSAPTPVALDNWTWDPGDDPSLTGDLRELYFNKADRVFRSSRGTPEEPWPLPLEVIELGLGGSSDTTPEVLADGLVLYFASDRGTNGGAFDIFVTTRSLRGGLWEMPTRVLELITVNADTSPSADAANVSIVVTSSNPEDFDIYLSQRSTTDDPWPTPSALGAVNSPSEDQTGFLSADGLSLYFTSTRAGSADLFVSRRESKQALFGAPEPLSELNTAFAEEDPWVSPDENEIYFRSNRSSINTLWRATR